MAYFIDADIFLKYSKLDILMISNHQENKN